MPNNANSKTSTAPHKDDEPKSETPPDGELPDAQLDGVAGGRSTNLQATSQNPNSDTIYQSVQKMA